jgi:hypothetical protein
LACADKILTSLVDLDKVARYFGLQHDADEKDTIVAKEMESNKSAIVLAIKSQAAVFHKSEKIVEFDEKMLLLGQWSKEENDPAVTLYKAWRLKRKGMFGLSLKMINKFLEKNAGKDVAVTKKIVDLREVILRDDLKWMCWSDYYATRKLISHPANKDIAW